MIKTVIIEDDLMVASINSQFAKKNPNIQITATFHSGKEALSFLRKNTVDLLLLDLYMPDCTGLELLSALRQDGNDVDVIMITAANDAAHINEALHLGIIDYLIKPFRYERFMEALDKYLLKHRILKSDTNFTQDTIDQLIQSIPLPEQSRKMELQKGLQPQTLKKIRECLTLHYGESLTSEQIASETSLSKVTVRRYMNFLIEENKVTSEVDYSTGGRPSIRYVVK